MAAARRAMQIIHSKEDFLYTIFPELAGGDDEQIIKVLTDYYSYGGFKPLVRIEQHLIIIEIDTNTISRHEADYRRAVSLCEKGNYPEAKPLLSKLIAENPSNSEYHRILGQILSDEGDQNEAINCLIDALRWDSKNGWALLMMGNIFAKFKRDIPTAIKYYDQAVLANPTDHTAIYNIGALFFQRRNYPEAKKYLWEAQKINPNYPNTHHVLAMIAEHENDLHSAFYSAIQSVKLSNPSDELSKNARMVAFDITQKIVATNTGKKIFREFRSQQEKECGKPIEIIEDPNINTAAKFEFAETYNRPEHIVKYNPGFPAVEHLIMHELIHLQLVTEARKAGLNKLFVSRPHQKELFMTKLQPVISKLLKLGVKNDEVTVYANGLFEGINLQAYNAPIDLFIEQFLYTEFPELRPFQFLSMFNLINQTLKGLGERMVVEVSPKDLLSKNKIYNIVTAMQFRDLYGIDFIPRFKASAYEMLEANNFYKEYLEYKPDRKPAEEYELVQHWAQDLKLDGYFDLVDETEFQCRQSIQNDPLLSMFGKVADAQSTNPATDDKETEMRRFLATQQANGTNADVVIYMVEALNYFEKLPMETIKTIAVKIALQGAHGYDPLKQYSPEAFPGQVFSGYQILAYYYVSFALALPEVLMELKLPYHEEYLLARGMKNGSN